MTITENYLMAIFIILVVGFTKIFWDLKSILEVIKEKTKGDKK